MKVRAILEEDRDDWKRLFKAYGMFYNVAFDDDLMHRVWAWLMTEAHEVSGLVVVDHKVVIGFAHYRRLMDTFTAGPGWSLDDLFVDSFARGNGAGKALVTGVKQHAKANGGGTVRWITAADNRSAQGLYDKVATRTSWVTYETKAD